MVLVVVVAVAAVVLIVIIVLVPVILNWNICGSDFLLVLTVAPNAVQLLLLGCCLETQNVQQRDRRHLMVHLLLCMRVCMYVYVYVSVCHRLSPNYRAR